MEFWNSLLTEKSWELLQKLAKQPFEFILIGGWAAFLWTKQHKSKDVDIALSDIKDIEFLKNSYNLKKNDHLKKYEISLGEIDIDIYVPYYSQLTIPVEELKEFSTQVEGFSVAGPEALMVLKQGAELDRKDSVKGIKDRIDIMSILCFVELDFKLYRSIIDRYKLEHFYSRLKTIAQTFQEYKYLDLNPREFKLKKKQILEKLTGA